MIHLNLQSNINSTILQSLFSLFVKNTHMSEFVYHIAFFFINIMPHFSLIRQKDQSISFQKLKTTFQKILHALLADIFSLLAISHKYIDHVFLTFILTPFRRKDRTMC